MKKSVLRNGLIVMVIGLFIGITVPPTIAYCNNISNQFTLTIISPNGGEIWSGNNTIIWKPPIILGLYCQFYKIYCIGNIGYKRYTLSTHWEDTGWTPDSPYAKFLWDTWSVPNDIYKIKVELWGTSDWECRNPTLIVEDTSDNYFTVYNNYPPTIDSIEGPRYGRPYTNYEYTLYGNDKDNDYLYYNVDWGDDTTVFIPQTEPPALVSHSWNDEGTYDITVGVYDGIAWSKNNKTVKMTIDSTPPNIEITKPKNGLYIFDRGPFPMSSPLIIGDITIKIEGTDSGSGISYAEFYIDNELKYTDTDKQFEWHWDEHALFTHKIKVIVYDNVDYTSEKEINVLIFNL